MKNIEKLARPELLTLKPYSSARDEFKGEADIFLDANENPFGFRYKGVPALNRYPDPLQGKLKATLSAKTGFAPEAIFAGNGSDEVIDLMIRAFCRTGIDSIIITPPTYGMYEVQARVHNVVVTEVPLLPGFLPDEEGLKVAEAAATANGTPAKLLFLCSPNNPTGNLISNETISRITEAFSGIVIVDEAYIDFSGTTGSLSLVSEYSNLMVVRTFSKARGLAGARLGVGYSNSFVTGLLNRIKLPYNVNSLTLDAGLRSLEAEEATNQQIALIISERERMSRKLAGMAGIIKVWPSDANFILTEVDSPKELYAYLLRCGIVVRDRSSLPGCEGCLRITVGTPPQNEALLDALKEFYENATAPDKEKRMAAVSRRTNETDIYVKFSPGAKGVADIQTGVGFLDHMLELLAFHSGSNLIIRGNGDLQVDAHHLAEDVALALGSAIAEVIRQQPVERYGFTLPMDESLATVAVDMGGRAVLVLGRGAEVSDARRSAFRDG
ncbi:MAG: histidinol-phosphate transaminase [Bacteroidales bacterium]|nr:histidinol-phosphate transaminase [Bacteroidales bacterium]